MILGMTSQQIITVVISVLAVIISFVSLYRTSRVQDQQWRLQKKQEELTDLQLEAIRRQGEHVIDATAQNAIIHERADIRVDLENTGRGSHRFIITNWGSVSARDITFDLDLPPGNPSPLVHGDYDVKIPIPKLAPGSRVPLMASITLAISPTFPARWSWRHPDGTVETRKTLLAI